MTEEQFANLTVKLWRLIKTEEILGNPLPDERQLLAGYRRALSLARLRKTGARRNSPR